MSHKVTINFTRPDYPAEVFVFEKKHEALNFAKRAFRDGFVYQNVKGELVAYPMHSTYKSVVSECEDAITVTTDGSNYTQV